MGFFGWFLYPILWNVLIRGGLILINEFQKILKYLTGDIIFDVLFTGYDFRIANIPAPFFAFGILSLVMILLLFFIQYVSLAFNDDLDFKTRIVKSLKNAVLSGLFVLMMPVVFYGLAWTFSFFQQALLLSFGIEDDELAKMIYYIGDPEWNGKIGIIPGDFDTPVNIASYNWLTQIFSTWTMMIIVLLLGTFIMKSFFELLVLFITGPIAAGTMVKDEGKIFRQWKDLVIGKVVVSLATIVAFGIFMMSINIFLKLTGDRFSYVTRQLFLVILIIGGGFMVLEVPQIAGSLVGHEVRSPRNWVRAQLPRLKQGVKHLSGFGNKSRLFGKATLPLANAPNFNPLPQSQSNRKRMTGIPGFLGSVRRASFSALSASGALGKIQQQKSFNQIHDSRMVTRYRQHRYQKLTNKSHLINQLHSKAQNKYQAKNSLKNERNLSKWSAKQLKNNQKLDKMTRK